MVETQAADAGDILKSKTDVYCRYLEALEAARRERFHNTRVFATLSLQAAVVAFVTSKLDGPRPYLWAALIVGVLVSVCWATLSRAARGNFRLKLDTVRALEQDLPLKPISTEAFYLKAKDVDELCQLDLRNAEKIEDDNARNTKITELKNHYNAKKLTVLSQRNHRYDRAEAWLPWVPAAGFALSLLFTVAFWR